MWFVNIVSTVDGSRSLAPVVGLVPLLRRVAMISALQAKVVSTYFVVLLLLPSRDR